VSLKWDLPLTKGKSASASVEGQDFVKKRFAYPFTEQTSSHIHNAFGIALEQFKGAVYFAPLQQN